MSNSRGIPGGSRGYSPALVGTLPKVGSAVIGVPRVGARRGWLAATLALTVGAFIAAIALAPAGDRSADGFLAWLLFVGSSAHVAATGWLYALPEVRWYAKRRPFRYIWVPVSLVVASAGAAAVLSPSRLLWALLAYFAWQFFHFQKQNLGLAALAGSAWKAASLTAHERWALVSSGIAGIAGLISHPHLLQLGISLKLDVVFAVAGAAFAVSVTGGLLLLSRRAAADRPAAFTAVYAVSLLFFAPVFIFSSPYAAVGGITVAHGLQYLLLVALIAGSDDDRSGRVVGLVVLANVALLGGLALNRTSHLHDAGPALRALYGAYLGVVMAHFVIDAGFWRLRDEFPRRFLARKLPYLVGQKPPQ
ncbi:MAG: hypothetical protein QOG03_1947 [Actinomycetota bacterium]|nr:hypothetical protein [Actinomycetota bacterium]